MQSLSPALSLVWPLGGSYHHRHASPWQGCGLTGRESAAGGPASAGKGGFRPGLGPPGPLAASAVAPSQSCMLATTIKVPFPVGTAVGLICLSTWTPSLARFLSIPGKPKPLLHRIAL